MQRTEHYRLNQPEPSDNYNIADANENMAAIDGALHSLEEGKANRAENPAAGNLASLDALGNPVDSGKHPGDFAPASHLADRANPHQVTVAQIGAAPSSHLESKGHMFQVTASLTPSGALELSGDLPAEKDGLTVQFVSPAAAADGLQAKFAGSDTLYPILTTGEGKEPIQAGAWDQGVPVTLTVSGGSCFFKVGAGDYGTLPPQTRITAKAGNAEISITLQTAADSPYFAGTLLVRKEGSTPEKVSDGVKIDVGKATAYTDTGLTNDTEYHYRAFAYTPKKRYQTELTGAVASAIPRAVPTGYTELVRFISSTTWTVPKDGYYQIYVLGKGGDGGAGTNVDVPKKNWTGFGGGGGGAGGGAIYQSFFTKGTEIPITINASVSSFGSYCSATSGKNGSTATTTTAGGSGGSGGAGAGGNISNLNGGSGGRGGIGAVAGVTGNVTTGDIPENGKNGTYGGEGGNTKVLEISSTRKIRSGGGGGGGGGVQAGRFDYKANGGDGAEYIKFTSQSESYSEAGNGQSGVYGAGGGGGGGGAKAESNNSGPFDGGKGGLGAPGIIIIDEGVYN